MLLSQKIHQLQDDTNKQTGFSDEMISGFTECIIHAERLEKEISDALESKKQGAILFSIYCNDNYISNGKREEYKLWQSCVTEDVYTTAELYKHFYK